MTGSYPIVVVNDANSASFYAMTFEECADPPDLTQLNEQNVPVQPGHHFAHYEIVPNAPGFPTVAVRPTAGEITSIGVAPRSAPGAFPTCDYVTVNGTNAAPSVSTSRSGRPYRSLASTTMLRPSGVSSASEASCAASASASIETEDTGMSRVA